jgi:hypothetical protein
MTYNMPMWNPYAGYPMVQPAGYYPMYPQQYWNGYTGGY